MPHVCFYTHTPERSRDCPRSLSKVLVAWQLLLPVLPSASPDRAGVVSSADIAATSGKTVDCIVTAERGRAQNHTTYYLTPKAVSQSWCRAGGYGFLRCLLEEEGQLGTR